MMALAKIVGDASARAVGAPGEQADHADRANSCALAWDDYAEGFRQALAGKGLRAWDNGESGAHAGPAIVGNFGGGRFFDYTAYGDTINVASRPGRRHRYSWAPVSWSAWLCCQGEEFSRYHPVGDLVLRGRAEAVRAFRAPPSKMAKRRSVIRELSAGICAVRGRRRTALVAFATHQASILRIYLASFHLKRL